MQLLSYTPICVLGVYP